MPFVADPQWFLQLKRKLLSDGTGGRQGQAGMQTMPVGYNDDVGLEMFG
jgi:hypothetical protein